MLQMLVHGRENLRRPFLEGRLSLMEHDEIDLSPKVAALTRGATTEVARLLRQAGVPTLDQSTTEGVMLMSKPNRTKRGFSTSVGIVAADDEARDELFARTVAVLT
jgi:hypothetical protein